MKMYNNLSIYERNGGQAHNRGSSLADNPHLRSDPGTFSPLREARRYAWREGWLRAHIVQLTKQKAVLLGVVRAGGHTEECVAAIRLDSSSPCLPSCANAHGEAIALCMEKVNASET